MGNIQSGSEGRERQRCRSLTRHLVGLASFLGPSVAVNFGPLVEVCWTAWWDGDALGFGLKRSVSPKSSAGVD